MFVLCVSVWYCTRSSSSQIANLLSRYFCFCMQGVTVRNIAGLYASDTSHQLFIFCLLRSHLTVLFSSVIMRLLLSVNACETLHWGEQVSKVFWFPWEGSEACELKSVKQYATVSMQLWTMLSCWVCSSQTHGSLRMLCHCMDSMFTSCFLPSIIPH